MIVHVTIRRDIDYYNIPYGINETNQYKEKLGDELRNRFKLKESDFILIDIVG